MPFTILLGAWPALLAVFFITLLSAFCPMTSGWEPKDVFPWRKWSRGLSTGQETARDELQKEASELFLDNSQLEEELCG